MTEPNLAELIRTCPHLSQSVHRTEQNRGEKNRKDEGKDCSPPPSPLAKPLHLQVYTILDSGIASIDHNDYGRPWPIPNRAALKGLTATHPADLCLKAAFEAKEIVQSQDRAPNITALFEKKLADLAEVRETVRSGLEAA